MGVKRAVDVRQGYFSRWQWFSCVQTNVTLPLYRLSMLLKATIPDTVPL